MTVFAKVVEVIVAEGNFENRSIQSKIFLFDPQYESKGPAKSKLSSSLGSRNGGSSLVCELGIIVFKFLPDIVHSEQFMP